MFKKSIEKIEKFLENPKNGSVNWPGVLGLLIAKEKNLRPKLALFTQLKKSMQYDKLANRLTFMCKILKYQESTVHLSVQLLSQILETETLEDLTVARKDLIVITSIFLASKMHEADPIPADELITFFDLKLKSENIIKIESEVLLTLDYDLNFVLLADYVDVLAITFKFDKFEYITLAFFSEILQFSIGGLKSRYNFELISAAVHLILS